MFGGMYQSPPGGGSPPPSPPGFPSEPGGAYGAELVPPGPVPPAEPDEWPPSAPLTAEPYG